MTIHNDSDYNRGVSVLQSHPVPHPQSANLRSQSARAACGDLLADLAWTQNATTEIDKLRHVVRLECLRMMTGYLLVTLDDEDAARH